LVSNHGSAIRKRNLVVAGLFFFLVVVAVGANGPPVLCRLGEGRPKLPSPLDAVSHSSVESSIAASWDSSVESSIAVSWAHENSTFVAPPGG
jgi:hypothetical protein